MMRLTIRGLILPKLVPTLRGHARDAPAAATQSVAAVEIQKYRLARV